MLENLIRVDTKFLDPHDVVDHAFDWMRADYDRQRDPDSMPIKFDEYSTDYLGELTKYTFWEWVPRDCDRLSRIAHLYVREGDTAVYLADEEYEYMFRAVRAVIAARACVREV